MNTVRLRQIVIAGGVTVLLLSGFGAIVLERDAESPAPAAVGNEAVSTQTVGAIGSGRSAQVDDSKPVDAIYTNNDLMGEVLPDGGKLVLVYLTLGNTGNRSIDFGDAEFLLIDNQGRVFEEVQGFEEQVAISAWIEQEGLQDSETQIPPGGAIRTVKVFRTSPGALDFELTIDGVRFETFS